MLIVKSCKHPHQSFARPTRLAPGRMFIFGLLALVMSSCGGQAKDKTGGTGSETDWLSACSADSDCDQGACLCGVCTTRCETESDCSNVTDDASCVPAGAIAKCTHEAAPPPALCADETLVKDEALVDGGLPLYVMNDDELGGGSGDDEPELGYPAPTRRDLGGLEPADVPVAPLNGKLDLLFVVDNSLDMGSKQRLLEEAVPELLRRLTSPACITTTGEAVLPGQTPTAPCPEGTRPQMQAMTDLHVGVITSSLGGYGAAVDCATDPRQELSVQKEDMAHLLGSLPRGKGAGGDFVRWTPDSALDDLVSDVSQQVVNAGNQGCGWESTLEAWYRFLVEPFPYTHVERQNCPGTTDVSQSCIGPALDDDGNIELDRDILKQRAQFLRPDSTVGIVVLSSENDCSFKASGQSWRLAQTINPDQTINSAFISSKACEENPNDVCCHSCGAPPPEGCPTSKNSDGRIVAEGCKKQIKYPTEIQTGGPTDDPTNLRCFEQKRRFGVDYLYPTERYVNALTQALICPFDDKASPNASACAGLGVNSNDLLLSEDEAGNPVARGTDRVFLATLVGVPWQDLVVPAERADLTDATTLRVNYGTSDDDTQRIDWELVLGEAGASIPNPEDPFMLESIGVRSGQHPLVGAAMSAPGDALNPINGHEFDTGYDLQFACTYPIVPIDCGTEDDGADANAGSPSPYCQCVEGTLESGSSLCLDENGDHGRLQSADGAYPGLRQLAVVRGLKDRGVASSICPIQVADSTQANYGYFPAVNAIVRRVADIVGD